MNADEVNARTQRATICTRRSLCGSTNEQLICHEKWRYDDKQGITTLVGFEIHCPNCDDALTHRKRLSTNLLLREILALLCLLLCEVNQCSPEMSVELLSHALMQWEQRNRKSWKIEVGAALVKKYPELARIVGVRSTPPTGLSATDADRIRRTRSNCCRAKRKLCATQRVFSAKKFS